MKNKNGLLWALILGVLLTAGGFAGMNIGAKKGPDAVPAAEIAEEGGLVTVEGSAESVDENAPVEEYDAEAEANAAQQRFDADYERLVAGLDAYPADSTVLRVGGQEYSWDEYYYILSSYLSSLLYQVGYLPETFDVDVGGVTMDQYLRDMVGEYFCICAALDERGGAVADRDAVEAQIAESWDQLIEINGDEETVIGLLKDSFMTKNSYAYFNRNQLYGLSLQDSLYGMGGADLTDEQLKAWADEQGLVRCKHILLLTNGEDMTDADKAAALGSMEAYLEDLKTLENDPEALAAEFDRLMNEVSEDTGTIVNPDGYIFGKGEMVPEFEEAAFALEEYQLSGVVQTDYGYHILLRLPMEKGIVADLDQSTYEFIELQQLAAEDLFAAQVREWQGDYTAEVTDEFADFTIDGLFNS